MTFQTLSAKFYLAQPLRLTFDMADIIKSDLASLERLAASFYDASYDQEIDTLNDVAKEIRLAVMDIQNLRDELIELEKLHANLERVGS